MIWQNNPYAFVLLIASIFCVMVIRLAWKRRNMVGALQLALMMGSIIIWTAAYAVELSAADLPTQFLMTKLEYIGILTVPAFWAGFVAQYTGQRGWFTGWKRIALILPPLLALICVWVPPLNSLIWSKISAEVGPGNALLFKSEKGPIFLGLIIPNAYVLLLIGTYLLVRTFRTASRLYRRQTLIMLLGAFAPWIANFLYITNLSPFGGALDLTPFAFTTTGLFISYGLFQYRLMDIVPVARESVFENITEGVLVLDEYARVTLSNPAALKMLSLTYDPVGRALPEVFAAAQVTALSQTPSGHPEYVNHTAAGDLIFEVRRSPFYDLTEHPIGELVLLSEITARRQYETELRQARDQAEQARDQAESANQAKSRFLSSMSHELRTPLNAILGFSEFISRAENLTPGQRENLSIINQSGEHLLEIINDILEISRIEAGRSALQEDDFDLQKFLQSIENILILRARQQETELVFSISPDAPRYIRTDQGKLRQALMNLLSNAIKFTHRGRVSLTLKTDTVEPERLIFAVEDTGVGIAPEEIGLLFSAFSQTSSGKRTQQGTGLGLAISRAFVQMMGGDIRVRSQPGQGSCFEFDIRVSHLTRLESESLPHGIMQRVRGLQSGQHAPDGGNYRLLVVDDVDANRRLMENILGTLGQRVDSGGSVVSGFEVCLAYDGQEAVKIWETWRPHLIWMDLRMPVMDGTEATRYIKAHPEGGSTVIIALTAAAFEEDRLQALSSGFDGFVRKPFREKFIVSALVEHLGIKFVYEDLPEQTESEQPLKTDNPAANARQALPEVPAKWLRDMQQAIVEGEIQQLRSLAGQQPVLVERITKMIENFELDELSNLVGSLPVAGDQLISKS
jgi:signal transduction histidine kinase/CheY-like chemotaxis protein